MKYQFAPEQVHIEIVELLKQLEPQFEKLIVLDEGEYYETGDLKTLVEHRRQCDEFIQRCLAEPGNKGPLRLGSGRIVDLVLKGGF